MVYPVLERFFDRVNHDRQLAAVAERVADKRTLKLIRAFLEAGVMEDGLVSPIDEGNPPGGPLSQAKENSAAIALKAIGRFRGSTSGKKRGELAASAPTQVAKRPRRICGAGSGILATGNTFGTAGF